MKSLTQIAGIKSQMQGLVDTMNGTLQKFASESERIRADASRHPDYIKEKVDEARKRAFDAFDVSMNTLRELAQVAAAEAPFWSHTMLVLSQMRFADNLVNDSTIRLRYMSEFAAMHASLLQITIDNAKAELAQPDNAKADNWALLYCAALAGREREGQAGWRGMDLSDLKIPDQEAALEIIRNCEALAAHAEHIVAQASATPMSGLQKMQMARQMNPRPIAARVD